MRATWSIDLGGDRHVVEYRRPWWAHRAVILVDGAAVAQTTEPWVRLGVDHPFSLAGHGGIVHIRMGGATLSVDGRSPDTGLPLKVAPPMPWPLLAAAIVLMALPVGLGEVLAWGLAVVPAAVITGVGGGLVMTIWTRASWSRMRRLTLGVATALGALALSVVAAIGINGLTPIPSERPFAEWSRVEVPGGGFSLVFPSNPSGAATSKSSGGLIVQVHAFLSEDRSGIFGAGFTDYPGEPSDPGAFLESAVQNIAISNGGTLVEDQPVTAGGLTGRELTVSVPQSGSSGALVIHARVLLRAYRFYAVTAILKGSGGGAGSNVVPFLNSFALDAP